MAEIRLQLDVTTYHLTQQLETNHNEEHDQQNAPRSTSRGTSNVPSSSFPVQPTLTRTASVVSTMRNSSSSKRLCILQTSRLSELSYFSLVGITTQHVGITARSLLSTHPELLLLCGSSPGMLLYPEQFSNPGLHEVISRQLGTTSPLVPSRPATLEDVRLAITSSMMIRLSPRWNVLGTWLVHRQQPDFLDLDDDDDVSLQAVKFTIRNENAFLSVWADASELQMFPVRPKDLQFSDVEQLQDLMEQPDAEIHLKPSDQNNNRFFYLPKMTAGRLVSISRKLLDSSPFETYDDLRAYWKQQYGYELPEDSEGQVYFNVIFPYGGGERTIYTYPSCCVFKQQPLVIQPSAQSSHSTLIHFRHDLIQLLKNIFPAQQIQLDDLGDEPSSDGRTPWLDKLNRDLEQDAELKLKMKSGAGQLHTRTSKYFDAQESSSRRMTNAKITEYFTTQRPGCSMNVRRTANKIIFDPRTKIASGTKPPVNVEQLAFTRQLAKAPKAELRAWLKKNRVIFHPKDNHAQLTALVEKHLFG